METSLAGILPELLVGLSSIGLAAAFFYADPRSPTTRALALGLFANGWNFLQSPWVYQHQISGLRYFDLLLIVVAAAAFAEWLRRVALTAQTTPRVLALINGSMRGVQLTALAFLVSGWGAVDVLYDQLLYGSAELIHAGRPAVWWLWVALLLLATAGYIIGAALLFLQKIDPVERIRAVALAFAMPFLAAGLVTPADIAVLLNMTGQLIFLVGALRYHALQAERGQILRKFLSPEVEKIVRLRGMAHAMKPQALEIAAVACDLRGFTAFSQAHASDEVVKLLDEYYQAVGAAVARHAATIKDYAGDGILMLVGAPVPQADHARVGIALARDVMTAARTVAERWGTPEHALGVGIGVASGRVTVGGVGSTSRMEYTAVGPAVNLASRLCALAAAGEILVDTATAQQAGDRQLAERAPVPLKGFGDAVRHFVVTA